MTFLVPFVAAHLLLAHAGAPQPPSVQKLFEAGQYGELIQQVATDEAPSPEALYLAGQAALKLEPPDREAAKNAYARLAGAGDDNAAWTAIARSATALVDRAGNEALAAATQAVTLAPGQMFAQYQLGLAYGETRDWANAATAFEKATTLNPTFAYAHYYAGMASYQIKRVDKMAVSFERFLKLAPQAPERPAVEALLRSIRGR